MCVYMCTTIVYWRTTDTLIVLFYFNEKLFIYLFYFCTYNLQAHMTFDILIVSKNLEFDILSIIS
jgi:hypothetical protein